MAFTLLWPMVYLASTKPLFTKPGANGMGRMEVLRAETAENRRREQEAAKRDEEAGGPRGVSATVRGPGGSVSPDQGSSPSASTTTMFLPRRDDSEEEGR